MSARRMGRNPFEQRRAPAAEAAAPLAKAEEFAAEKPRADLAEPAARDSSYETAGRPASAFERATDWMLVELPANAFMLALRNVLKFRS